MKPYTHAAWLAVAVLALAAGFGLGRYDGYRTAHHHRRSRGMPRMRFALPDLAGKARSLTHWPAKVYLVNFWAPWCPPCRAEIPLLRAAARQYKAQGLGIIGIALDHKKAVASFVQVHHIRYPVLLGGEQGLQMLAKFGDVQGAIPFSLFVTPHGRIITGQLGAFTRQSLAPP